MSDDCPKETGCKWPHCVGPHGGCNYLMVDELYKFPATHVDTLRQQLSDAQSDAAECDALREKMSAILTATANALKGEPPPLVTHSWHDLAEVAKALKAERDWYLTALQWIADPAKVQSHGDPQVLRMHAETSIKVPK